MDSLLRAHGKLKFDQEGGLTGHGAEAFCERFNITRVLLGKHAFGSKGLVERHIQITKHTSLILKEDVMKLGLSVSDDEIIQEATMSQNIVLEYGGGSPQTALTGQTARLFYDIDGDGVTSVTGASESLPEAFETALRRRLLAKQCVQRSMIEERISCQSASACCAPVVACARLDH